MPKDKKISNMKSDKIPLLWDQDDDVEDERQQNSKNDLSRDNWSRISFMGKKNSSSSSKDDSKNSKNKKIFQCMIFYLLMVIQLLLLKVHKNQNK